MKKGTSFELLISLPAGRGKRLALESTLRDAIKEKRLRGGEALPSTRSLAADLGVSRRLVVEAYEQLVSEGYLVARERHHTEVAALAAASSLRPPGTEEDPIPSGDAWRPGAPDPTAFPGARWARLLKEAVGRPETLRYCDPAGLEVLRVELSGYLRRVRAVVCDAAQVRVTNGLSGALTLWARCLAAQGVRRVALEHPGPDGLWDRLRRLDLEVLPLPVDGEGACVHHLEDLDAGAVVLTPAHQFPLGSVLSPERRARLVAWARQRQGWIFEDDYDAEYRFSGHPIGSLQGLAPDRVATSSSVSKTLAPGLRLGWLVLPPSLLDVARARSLDLGQPGPQQWALAHLLASGDYDRHVRRQRRVYRQRRRDLGEVLRSHPRLHPRGTRAGLHVWVELKGGGWQEADRLRQTARERGIELTTAWPYYWAGPTATDPAALVLGYAAFPQARWPQALAALDRALS